MVHFRWPEFLLYGSEHILPNGKIIWYHLIIILLTFLLEPNVGKISTFGWARQSSGSLH